MSVTAPTDEAAPDVAPIEFELDAKCAEAIELARAAAIETAGAEVGEHLGVRAEGERLATHAFAASLAGYVGWYWAVTVSRAHDAEPTVAEVVLLPGADAVLATQWLPWSERLKPGDLSPGDLLPTGPDDPRLVPAYVLSDDPQVEEVAFELGLGRVRVLSREGRLDAADRWYAGDAGPNSPMAKQAPGQCGTCGFLIALEGSLRAAFGVCANEISATDGQVVSVEYGCGAHSEAIVDVVPEELGQVFDDSEIELVAVVPDEQPAEGSAAPADDIVEQPLVEAELLPIEAADRDDSAGVEAQDESGAEQFGDGDTAQLDPPATVAGGVDEPAPGDAGEDIVG
jgi:hypothetical protein